MGRDRPVQEASGLPTDTVQAARRLDDTDPDARAPDGDLLVKIGKAGTVADETGADGVTSANDNSISSLLRDARGHLGNRRFDLAVDVATEAIRLDHSRSEIYVIRAEALRKLNKADRALADLALAIRLDPDRAAPYVIRAEIYRKRCLLDQAIADATQAIFLDPNNAAAFSIRASCRQSIGDPEGAAADQDEMFRIDPTRSVPDLGTRPSPGSSTSAVESGEKGFWKRAGDHCEGIDRSVLAGGAVDVSYRSRPAVTDEDAPEALGLASGYKPETTARPIPRGRRKGRSPHGRGGLLPILGVAIVLGGGIWLAFRGVAGDKQARPQMPPEARSDARPPLPVPTRPNSGVTTTSVPAKSPGHEPVVRDLGSSSTNKAGRSWTVVMPDRYTKAEVAFYRGDPGDRTLNAAWEGNLRINNRDIVRFGGSPRSGVFSFHDSTTGTDYEEVNDYRHREPERLLDVTAYLQSGENSFFYYHEQRPDLPMGLVLIVTGDGGASTPPDAKPAATTRDSTVMGTESAGPSTGVGLASPEGMAGDDGRKPTTGAIRSFDGHTGTVLGVAFSPDRKLVASASGDATVRVWSTAAAPSDNGHVLLATPEPRTKGFIAVAFTPDGKSLAASRFDGSIALWDMAVSPPKLSRVFRKHSDPVVALAFSPDGKSLVSGGRDEGLICFWDMTRPGDTPRATIPAEKNGVWSLAFSPDGKTLAEGVSLPPRGSGTISGEVWMWDVERRPYIKRSVIKEVRKVPRSLAFSPDGGRLAFGDGDVARVVEAGTGRSLGSFEGHSSYVVTVAFTPDGKRILSGGYDNALYLWATATMGQICRFDGHTGYVEQVAVSPDGRMAASVGHDKTVRLWGLPR